MHGQDEHPVILFDGRCGLCSRLVQFVIRHDRRKVFRFAPLQSALGRSMLRERGRDPDALDTIVLIQPRRTLIRSDAMLSILRRLRMPWPLLTVLALAPRPVRDAAYRWIARRRHRWFGAGEPCPAFGPDARERFLA